MPSPALGDLSGDGIPEVVDVERRRLGARLQRQRHAAVGDAPLGVQPGAGGRSGRVADDRRHERRRSQRRRRRQQLRLLRPERRQRRDHDGGRQFESHESVGRGRRLRLRRRVASHRRRASTRRTTRAGCRRSRCRRPAYAVPWGMFRRDPLHHAGPVALHLLPRGPVPRESEPARRIRSRRRRRATGSWARTAASTR